MDMKIRRTELQDLENVMAIYAYARGQMKLNGNPDQWGDTNPPEDVIRGDIQNKNSYVLTENGILCGVFSFIIGEDPTYREIDGEWLKDGVYGTIHRIAGGRLSKGVFDACLKFCESRISSIRIDTHRDNKIMQHLILKNGFRKCGIIYLPNGSPRIAYQKVIDDETFEEGK